MAEMGLYPENLKGLDLNFEEAVYAIAFGLENEIYLREKVAVFKEFNMTGEEMKKRVENCLNKEMNQVQAYALKRVLGDLDSADDKRMLGCSSLEEAFGHAVRVLCSPAKVQYGKVTNCRYALAKGEIPIVRYSNEESSPDIERLYAEVQQLREEVRVYEEKHAQALVRIEALLTVIKGRQDCPTYFRKGWTETTEKMSQEIDLDGPVTQIFWPCCSKEVILRELRLSTMKEVVEYFQDFENFVEGDEITLWEWLVIVAILRKNELLPSKGQLERFEVDDVIASLEFSVRTYNCLSRAGVKDIDDVIVKFADGAAEGWDAIWRIRNLGRKSYDEIIQTLGEKEISLSKSACFPTIESEVRVLDFNSNNRLKLQHYGIETIGELLGACANENRLTGLKYLDEALYRTAKAQLGKYGCN